jgi:phage baseplate assembly protein V
VSAFRVGIVSAQNPATAQVRVTFPDRSQMQSWWLGIVVPHTQNDKAYWIPDLGEQVVCLMDEYDEDGAVLGALYSTVDIPPIDSLNKSFHLTTQDSATFDYDRAAHGLTIALPAGATLSISASGATVAIDASGDVSVTAAGEVNVSGSGQVNITGSAIVLAGGGPAVARVGDTTVCPAGTGHITSGSSKTQSG